MFPLKKTSALAIFMALTILPSLSYSDVKIVLKNGRTIIADYCEEEGRLLVCSKMGGTFDVEKKDVASVKETAVRSMDSYESQSAEPPAAPKPERATKGEGTVGGDVKDAPAAAESGAKQRVEDVRKRKAELAPERDKLMQERQQLQEDLKKAPDWMPVKQQEDLSKRAAELDEKIKKFNEEAGRLNAEEKSIVEEQKKKD